MSNSVIGRWSSLAVFLIGMAYFLALLVGFATRGLSAPIVDPLLAIMEVLTLISALALFVMMATVHGRAPAERRTTSIIALGFMMLAMGVTSAVHFVELTAMRQLGTASLVWPSTAYALEVLAWDLLLGLSLGCAALTFEDHGRERRVRRGLLGCGALCLLGLVGPAVGNMRLQFVGVFGYAVLLPIVCLLLSMLFRHDTDGPPSIRTRGS